MCGRLALQDSTGGVGGISQSNALFTFDWIEVFLCYLMRFTLHGTDWDIKNQNSSCVEWKNGKLWSTNKKVVFAHVDLPDSGLAFSQISSAKFVAKWLWCVLTEQATLPVANMSAPRGNSDYGKTKSKCVFNTKRRSTAGGVRGLNRSALCRNTSCEYSVAVSYGVWILWIELTVRNVLFAWDVVCLLV